MAKYWQIIYRTGEEDYETKEVLINNDDYRCIQEVLMDGGDFIILKDKPTIKRTSIVSINPADEIVSEYQKDGLKIDGLLNPAERPRLTGEIKKVGDFLKDDHERFFARMKWEHKPDCVCKNFQAANKPNED